MGKATRFEGRGAWYRRVRRLASIAAAATLCAMFGPNLALAHSREAGVPIVTASCGTAPAASTTVDGVRYQDIPAAPTVAWVVNLTQRPGWVLAGDPLALMLSVLHYQPVPGFRSAATYEGYLSPDRRREFDIATWLVDPSEASNECVQMFVSVSTRKPATATGVQDVSLSIAGAPVQGQYFEIPGYRTLIGPHATRASGGLVQTFRAVVIDSGALRITLSARGLSRDEFMGAIGALVDGRTHPDVVARLQHEMDGAEPSTPH